MTPHTVMRARLWYVALACAAVALGLAVHRGVLATSVSVRDITGDAMWALMIAAWISALVPRARLRTRCAASLLLCWTVEFSQLWRTPALDAIRGTTLGHLVLGSDFDARDLVAYALGIGTFALIDRAVRRRA